MIRLTLQEEFKSKTYDLSEDYVTVDDAKHRHLSLNTPSRQCS